MRVSQEAHTLYIQSAYTVHDTLTAHVMMR
jgi:hypothetical protein